jgi:NAD(P)-dependent dehydrogenase (short-subunit alcohol dehydrogenase family)
MDIDERFRPPGPSPRLADKVAVVVGAGQTPGTTIGNGRATAILFAHEGARLLLVDRDRESAEETAEITRAAGADTEVLAADIADEEQARAIATTAVDRFGRIDVLHNNVGIGAGDGGVTTLEREIWDKIFAVNVTGAYLTCKHAVPVMREAGRGSIVNISSIAAIASAGLAAYKASKAALNALTHHLSTANARYGIRANGIMPGLMDTPMAIEGISAARRLPQEQVREERHRQVPLGRHMGTGWDTAYAALFLASDEARFITGVLLAVDGGQSARVG